ncbi:MAG: large subunit ribosomal protein L29 [Actinomycetes bacterium]|jgi:large subunit ribosomal protein L29
MAALTSTSELREMDDQGLETKLIEAKEELFNLRFQAATGQLDSYGRLKAVRREIARVYTIMRERELGITANEDEEGAA